MTVSLRTVLISSVVKVFMEVDHTDRTFSFTDDIPYDLVANGEYWLGLDHVDRSRGFLSGRGDGIIIR